ncbi:uncharacterized protein DUF4421 [Neolewinella xylanilytica]|uniref:Uncharacterized protein DUF4421 n=1 Tax=Neolewinella xylanilytica TaxID=1514080 RepID=A0A2S6I5N7_9BACT|nr:DUF4421 family protein [Neolewinella xylanilytica]PPK86486.1 uncharacterized protein DUF4421 [Neolewinella xylanilytica]
MGSRALRCLFLLIGMLQLATAVAQFDSTYVETFASRTRVNGGLRYRDNSASISVGGAQSLTLSNKGLAVRFGGRYKWLGYTFSIPVSDLGTDSELGDATSLGVNLQLYRDKFYLNLNARRTVGFVRRSPGDPDYFRRDIKFLNILVYGFRILNSKEFSLGSAFRQRSRQLKNSGSFLLAGMANRQVLTANQLTLPAPESDALVIDRYSQVKFGVGLGYAYTFLFGKNLFVTPLAVVGPEVRFVDYDPVASQREVEGVRLSLRFRTRLAFGYNGRHNYLAITAAYLPSYDATETLDTRVDETRIELILGHRFHGTR